MLSLWRGPSTEGTTTRSLLSRRGALGRGRRRPSRGTRSCCGTRDCSTNTTGIRKECRRVVEGVGGSALVAHLAHLVKIVEDREECARPPRHKRSERQRALLRRWRPNDLLVVRLEVVPRGLLRHDAEERGTYKPVRLATAELAGIVREQDVLVSTQVVRLHVAAQRARV